MEDVFTREMEKELLAQRTYLDSLVAKESTEMLLERGFTKYFDQKHCTTIDMSLAPSPKINAQRIKNIAEEKGLLGESLAVFGEGSTGKTSCTEELAEIAGYSRISLGEVFRFVTYGVRLFLENEMSLQSLDSHLKNGIVADLQNIKLVPVGPVCHIYTKNDQEDLSALYKDEFRKPLIERCVPDIAKLAQAEVLAFVQREIESLAGDGVPILIEGRKHHTDFFPVRHWFEAWVPFETAVDWRFAQRQKGAKS